MYIKKIILKNFKSFGSKVEIPFFKGFTVISGPNGSGKSNIIDSIVFCLGLSSSRALRAEKLTDLIHTGKSEAEVSITFSENITVTRRIKVTEKGYYSYYYLNGKQCSLTDIQEYLSKTGIHENAYNVIMQGDVTRLAEMTPYQRRKIIDDIAGISEFDEKKERAMEELEKVRENIEKIEAVLREVSSRLKQLEKDREEAIKYKNLLDEKNYFSKVIETHHYRILLSKKEKLKKEVEKLESDRDRLIEKVASFGEEIEKLSREVKEISSEIARITGSAYDSITQRITEIESEIKGIEKLEEEYKHRIEKLREEITEKNLKIAELEREKSELLKSVEQAEVERASLQSLADELSVKLEILRSKMEELDLREKEIKNRLFTEKDKLDKLKEKRSELLREKDRLVNRARMLELNAESLREKIKSTEIKEIDEKIEKISEEINRAEIEAGRIVKRKNELDKEYFSLRDALSDIEDRIKHIEVEIAKVRAEMSVMESGLSRGVELVLEAKERRALPGIFGTVAQLCEVEERFALALETAAGNALQYIVVENEDDAVRAINYLKQIKGGRATFLPLSRIKKNFGKIELDSSILSFPGVVDYAVNLVKCDRKFKPVFNYVFRETLVVDRIETARRLMDKFKGRMVTLDGDLVERSGVMSGGYAEKKRMFLISKDLIKKEKELLEEITVLKSEKSRISAEVKRVEDEIKKVRRELEEISGKIKERKEKLDSLKSRKAKELKAIETLKEEIEKIEKEKLEISNKIKEKELEISKIEKLVKEKEDEVETLRKKLKGSELERLEEMYEKLREEFSSVKDRLNNAESRVKSLEMRIKQIQESEEEKKGEVEKIEEEVKELMEKIEAGKNRISQLKEEEEKLKRKEERIGKQVTELRRKRDEMFEKLKMLESGRDRCKYSLTTIEERIRARKDAISNVNVEIDKVDTSRILEGEIPPMEEAIKKVEEIEKILKGFGEVNMKAIQEYEEVKRRRDELLGKKLSLEEERTEIMKRIEKYEKMKKEAFFETFNAIRENFSKVIEILTDGKGELYLEGEDPFSSGLNIKVKPYGKPVQRIESLSGGEKSLIALALIFAIQMYRPAPFYAFDEIDMFLDGANVSRVAKLIKERSKDAQFIVVSLRKPTLEMADAIVGVTMGKNGSKVTGIRLKKEVVEVEQP